MNRICRPAAAILLLSASAEARVISYSPYHDRAATPAVQSRLNRHFVLIEQASASSSVPPFGSPVPPNFGFPTGQVVLYDSQGAEEARVVFPQDGSNAPIMSAAAREEGDAVSILIQTTANLNGTNPNFLAIWVMSSDSGATWKRVAIPVVNPTATISGPDNGGPFVRSRYSNVRIGARDFPFVVAETTSGAQAIYVIGSDPSVKPVLISGT